MGQEESMSKKSQSGMILERVVKLSEHAHKYAEAGKKILDKDPLAFDDPFISAYIKKIGDDALYSFLKNTYNEYLGNNKITGDDTNG